MRSIHNRGFTLFKLVLVLTIVGIITIIAAPKSLSMSATAKQRILESFVGAHKSMEKLVKTQLHLEGKDVNSNKVIRTKDGVLYKDEAVVRTLDNLVKAMDISGYKIVTFWDTDSALILPPSVKIESKDGVTLFEYFQASSSNCYLELRDNSSNGGTQYKLEFSGC